jgi:sec-independent protein translocase protein TatB
MGKFLGKARAMAREFQNNVDDMVREAELDEVKKQVQKLEYGGLEQMIQDSVDPKGRIQDALRAPDITAPPAAPAAPVSAAAPAVPTPAAAQAVAATASAPKLPSTGA